MTSPFIILFMFIHNSTTDSSSKNGRKSCSRIASAQAVLANFAILTFSSPLTNFNTKVVNFALKLVLPVLLKEIQSIIFNFSHFYFTSIARIVS